MLGILNNNTQLKVGGIGVMFVAYLATLIYEIADNQGVIR